MGRFRTPVCHRAANAVFLPVPASIGRRDENAIGIVSFHESHTHLEINKHLVFTISLTDKFYLTILFHG